MAKNCATCRHHLGAGACRVNLESECGAGEFEAWESAEVGRESAPCRGCADREVGCHRRCPRYAKWWKKRDGVSAAEWLERMANEEVGCHRRCPRYAKWWKKRDGVSAAEWLERMANEVIAGSCVQVLERMRKKRGGR